MKKQSDTFGTQPSANRNIKVAPSANPVDELDGKDPVAAFMEKYPNPSNGPDPEDDIVGLPVVAEGEPIAPAPETETPPVEQPKTDSQGEPVAEPPAEPKTDDTPPAEPAAPAGGAPVAKKEEKPADAPVAAPAAKVVEPPKPSYAADEKIALVEGQEPWTRAQVVAALGDRVKLQPLAKEAEDFRGLFGFDFAKAKQEWEPIITELKAHPERAKLLTEVLNTDPATFEYLQQSAAWFNSPEGLAARGLTARPATETKATLNKQPTPDPRLERMEKLGDKMYAQLRDSKIQRELKEATTRYPFLAKAPREVWDALGRTADILTERAKAAGADELEFNGLAKALDENKYLYDQMQTFYAAQQIVKTVEPPPLAETTPTKGPEALLGSTGAAPGGAARARTQEDYTGNSDDAVAAFLRDQSGR